MIATLIVLLITGYLVYRLIRHPIKSFKFIGAVLGLLLLGAIVYLGKSEDRKVIGYCYLEWKENTK